MAAAVPSETLLLYVDLGQLFDGGLVTDGAVLSS